MSKIVRAVNVMVSNPSLFSEVLKGMNETEVFFKYANKHCWSILENSSNEYYLHYYPSNPDLTELSDIPDEVWDHHAPRSLSYNTAELATKEARDSFSELFAIVSEKVYGMEDILNDIISSDDPFA